MTGKDHPTSSSAVVDLKNDEIALERLGYQQVLHRSYSLFENFSTSFAALYFVGGVRVTFTTGIAAGGPLAYWTSYIVTCVFTFITAAVIAEVCSAAPTAGSIYLWAAEAGGRRFGRLFGFIVAWWSTTAWTTFCASNTQSTVNYMLSELTVFNVDFPTDTSSIKFRALQWICTEVMLALAAWINLGSPRIFRYVFWLSTGAVFLDFILNLVWLPIGAHETYGLRTTHEAFMTTYNGTGAPAGWNWCLSYLATAGILIGFDASGHVAEETKNASLNAAKGIFWSTVISGVLGLTAVILFLFTTPPIDVLFSYDAPQPFVPLYAVALGRGGHIIMNILSIVALWLNTAIAITAASRLVFAVARDGEEGQPRNAILVVWGVSALITCTILPSAVAFTSLVSAAGVPSAAAYGLISLGRLTLTRKEKLDAKWSLGRWSKPFQLIAVIWNAWVVAVLFSPYEFPVTAGTLNYAPIIMAIVTIFAVVSWYLTPADAWLRQELIEQVAAASTEAADS
ncbi:amino acid transporter [Aspergillus heteromorphus CBS 117.55]|uniref:Amino acid transporter n=1 Tax=Aspergillus heteromorphus CBS 117.55 TaxID=1448321 RepID=A0A317WBJ6_9EURO|nr:amino acid transporter [Aspergillus heteromorphus CBS 117.55]PWY83569.1 amino acid transporter [Aspergillus heteromorphus CBS 117.55]